MSLYDIQLDLGVQVRESSKVQEKHFSTLTFGKYECIFLNLLFDGQNHQIKFI